MFSDILNIWGSDDKPCKHCGYYIAKEANFCSHCGKSQTENELRELWGTLKDTYNALTEGMSDPPPVNRGNKCRYCGEPVSAETTTCPHCQGYRPVQTQGKKPPTTKQCKHCSVEIPISATYCKHCDHYQLQGAPRSHDFTPTTASSRHKQCGYCERLIPYNASACPHCISSRPLDNKKHCSSCSRAIPHNALICGYCNQTQRQSSPQRTQEMLAREGLKSCSNCERAIPLAALICKYCEQTQREQRAISQSPQPQITIHEPELLEQIRLVAPPIEMPQFIPESLPQQRTPDQEDRLIANAFHLSLTPEERQRLNLFNKGYSHAEIAQLYQVHEGRVRQWEEELCQRFLTTSKVEMLSLARQAGFIKKQNNS